MSLELRKYLIILRKEASRFERTDINNVVNEGFFAKFGVKITFTAISIILLWLLKNGFSSDFISYVSDVLSIIVGLFITALIFSFDKFYEPTKEDNPDSRIKLWDVQAYNYAKKFAYITSYTIVLSVFTLVVLAVSTLFQKATSTNISSLTLSNDITSIESIKLFFIAAFVVFQRFFVVYWLLKIVYNTLFIVSSMVQYMTTKIDRK